MRLIGTLSNESSARRLSTYLKRNGVLNSCEMTFDASTGHMSYPIWIHDEDQMEMARNIFDRFQREPGHREFDVPTIEQLTAEVKPPEAPLMSEQVPRKAPITAFFLSLCALVFFWNFLQVNTFFQEGIPPESILMTPVDDWLFYDVPAPFEELEKIIEQKPLQQNAAELKAQIEAVEKMPFWRGFYDLFLLKVQGKDPSTAEGPVFTKIKEGEVWRLFTPCILHRDFLHILFNMIWLWALGRPIEQKIGSLRTLGLTLVAGIASNTAQYLMSGPFFLGYSGVIMGLAGFIWMRERIAPWEGYPVQKTVLSFLFFFILALFGLQFGSFLLLVFTSIDFSPSIANTAHVVGALVGALLGRLSFFEAGKKP
ncbi:MAG: rhomboid family intramembrane serine protease [Verrucomicrobiota bacterium]|nr:rhomboid family intramembrane serine protease [Verrucomicrobiota bacterium]